MSAIAGQPLTHCPVCRYDLTGLPKNHRCPECGFEYDETMRIWMGTNRSGWFWVLSAMHFSVAVLLSVALLTGLARPGSISLENLIKSLAFAVGWVIVARYRRARTFTSLGSQGIAYKTSFRSVRQIAWSNIRCSGSFDYPMQRSGDNWKFLRLPLSHLRKADRECLLSAIRDRSRAHGSSGGTAIDSEPNAQGEQII